MKIRTTGAVELRRGSRPTASPSGRAPCRRASSRRRRAGGSSGRAAARSAAAASAGGCPARPRGDEHMFAMLGPSMTVEYREEPAALRSTGCRAWGSRGRSTPTWAASTAARSVTSARSSGAPSGRRTTATGRASASRRTSPRCCGSELARPSWQREVVAIGAATDPYQPAEGRYKLTRACLEVLGEAANPFQIITRGPMIVRDVDVLVSRRAARRRARHVLGPDARRRDLAADGARDGAPAPAAARAEAARGRRHPRRRRHGADPPRHLRQARADGGRRPRCARGRRLRDLGEPSLSASPGTKEHFLAALERDWPELLPGLRAALRARGVRPNAEPRSARRCASSRGRTGSATGGR